MAAKTKNETKPVTVTAGERRSIARRFNDSLAVSTKKATKKLDQRTAKRLDRYREELTKGKSGKKTLTPFDIAQRVDELLAHGDKIGDLRKLMQPRQVDFDFDHLVEILKEMHPIYGYRPTAYRFAGVPNEALLAAGIIDRIPAKRGPKAKKS